MRFCIVTPKVGFNDGQGRVNLEIAAEMLRQGHEVLLIAEHVDAAAVPQARRVVVPPPPWLPSRLLRDQVLAWRTAAALRDTRNRCDAVLANGFVSWGHSDVNAVHFVHGSWLRSVFHPWKLRRSPRTFYARIFSALNAKLEKGALRRCSRVVAVSEKVRQELLLAGVPDESIKVVANGVDADQFHPGPSERARFGLPDGATVAFFAGDLKSPRKNLETVLRALVEIPSMHLAIAGRTEGSVYPTLARSMGLGGRAHFLGFQKDIPALMRSVDLFVFPSRYEACSLVLLEAMASGLPVVTARSAGGSELITPDIGIVLEDSDDCAALVTALRSLVMDPDRRQVMSEAGYRQALNHSWGGMAQRYIDLLCNVAERRPPVVPRQRVNDRESEQVDRQTVAAHQQGSRS